MLGRQAAGAGSVSQKTRGPKASHSCGPSVVSARPGQAKQEEAPKPEPRAALQPTRVKLLVIGNVEEIRERYK